MATRKYGILETYARQDLVKSLKSQGKTYAEIGEMMGLSKGRIGQMYQAYLMRQRSIARKHLRLDNFTP